MNLDKVIDERRSVRHYLNKEIDNSIIKEILNSAIKAPSAKNRQPWHFIVIKNDKNLKNKIGNDLYLKMGDTAKLTSDVIKECSALVLVYASIEHVILDVQSVGACIQNMLLKAYDVNVASLWIGYILEIENELKEVLKTDKQLIAAVALGYSDRVIKARPRKSLEEVSEWL